MSGNQGESFVRSHDGDRGVQSAKESHGYVVIAVSPDGAMQRRFSWDGGFRRSGGVYTEQEGGRQLFRAANVVLVLQLGFQFCRQLFCDSSVNADFAPTKLYQELSHY